MARGTSGRLVIEVEPSLKNALYERFRLEGLTLKEWFTTKADEYLARQAVRGADLPRQARMGRSRQGE